MLLEQGYRWRVGNGAKINILNTPWLRCSENPRIQSLPVLPYAYTKVNSLIDFNGGGWNVDLVTNVFSPRDATEILKIPLVNMHGEDKVIWRFDKKGQYSVKSAYRVCMEVLADKEDLKVDGDWPTIWSMKVPPKVKSFLWRLCRNCIPVRTRLQRKGVQCPMSCVRCDSEPETSWHVFLDCPSSNICWQKLNLWHIIEPFLLVSNDFSALFFQVIKHLSAENVSIFAMTLWSIWKSRNLKLWESTQEEPHIILSRAMEVHKGWRFAQESSKFTPPRRAAAQNSVWCPPPMHFLKFNIDAAILKNQNKVGVGVCVRNASGQFVNGVTDWMDATMTPAEGEAWGLLQGLKWAVYSSYDLVHFELDCKQVVEDVQQTTSDSTEYGCILKECRAILSLKNNYKVVFARRQANGSAHALAKASTLHATRNVFRSVPSCIWNIVCNEMK